MARAKQKKKVLLRRLAKRRTRYEAAPVQDSSFDEFHRKRRESDDSRPWLEIDDALLIEV